MLVDGRVIPQHHSRVFTYTPGCGVGGWRETVNVVQSLLSRGDIYARALILSDILSFKNGGLQSWPSALWTKLNGGLTK